MDQTTALKIKSAAREVFIERGYDGATMQVIADRAGFNKAQLHYYYRSKDALFLLVFQEELRARMSAGIPILFESGKSIREKLEDYVDAETEFLAANPGIALFTISEIHRNPDLVMKLLADVSIPGIAEHIAGFSRELKEAGCPYSFEEIMMVLRSILVYPSLDETFTGLILNLTPQAVTEIRDRTGMVAKALIRRLLGDA